MEEESKKFKIRLIDIIAIIAIILIALIIIFMLVFYNKENRINNTNDKALRIENSESLNRKKIVNDLNKNIDESKIISMINLSKEEFYEYKNKFLGKESKGISNNIIQKNESKKAAKRNFLVLENFILNSDKKLTQSLYEYLNTNFEDKYNMIYARVFSGMIKFYFADIRIENMSIVSRTDGPAGGKQIEIDINSNYILAYCFGAKEYDENSFYEDIGLYGFEGVSSFDEARDKDIKKYIDTKIMSYDYIEYWANLSNFTTN